MCVYITFYVSINEFFDLYLEPSYLLAIVNTAAVDIRA